MFRLLYSYHQAKYRTSLMMAIYSRNMKLIVAYR